MRTPLLATLLFVACLFFFSAANSTYAASIIRAPNNLGLVGYWSFDEGRGDHASDLSGRGNDGTIINTTGSWWVAGKTGTAVDLDGSNDSIQTDHWYPLESLTFSTWIYPTRNNAVEGYGRTIAAASSQTNFYNFWLLLAGSELRLMTYGSTPAPTNISGANIGLNQWHHIAFTTSRNGNTAVYVDGVKVHEFSSGTVSGTAGYLTIGDLRPNRGISFDGSIDEVRAYSRELSETEIQTLYNNTKGVIVGTTNSTYTDGLVAHYTFDGSTISGATLKDVAGSNDGIIPNGPTPTIGRIGQGMKFNGQGTNGINLGNSPTLNPNRFTVAAWVKIDTATSYNYIYSNARDCCSPYNGIDLRVNNNGVVNGRIMNGAGVSVTTGANAVPSGVWTHVAFSYDGSNMRLYVNGALSNTQATTTDPGTPASYNARLGSMGHDNGSYYTLNGLLDDVRIYSRVLSPEEIRGLAGSSIATLHSSSDNLVTSGLEGHWSFDESTISGTTVADISGNGQHGTITGATETTGVIGGALQFDGVDDRVAIGVPLNLPENWSYAFWMYADGVPSGDHAGLVGQTNNPRTVIMKNLTIQAGAAYPAGGGWAGDSSSPPLSIGDWYHVVSVWQNASSGSPTGQLYINGELVGSRAYAGAIIRPNQTHFVNQRDSARSFLGKIDDVRIYSRALSPSEIQTLYSMGQ